LASRQRTLALLEGATPAVVLRGGEVFDRLVAGAGSAYARGRVAQSIAAGTTVRPITV
jgi:hypothetical protein